MNPENIDMAILSHMGYIHFNGAVLENLTFCSHVLLPFGWELFPNLNHCLNVSDALARSRSILPLNKHEELDSIDTI